jgi:hypothetical protein
MFRCEECSSTAEDYSPGWRAYIAEPDESDDGEFVVVYCPQCAAREFGRLGSRGMNGPAQAGE